MTKHYPIMIDIENKPCLIIGGGNVAYRKAQELLNSKASVKIVSNEVNEQIKSLIDEKQISFLGEEFDSAFLDKVFLVIIATNDKKVNNEILKQCNERNILVNSVDNPKESSFISPSKIKKGDITISISTNGKSPILNKIIRNKLNEVIEDSYSDYNDILGEFRVKALIEINDEKLRREFFYKITSEEYLNLIKMHGKEFAYKKIQEIFIKYIVGH